MGIKDFVIKSGLTLLSNLLVANSTANAVGIGNSSPAVKLHITGTDALLLPVGNTAQRPTGANGYIRYNNELNSVEGFTNNAWGSIGGGTSVAGSNTQIQYNNSSTLGASSNLVFNSATNTLGVPTIQAPGTLDLTLSSSNATAANDGGIIISGAGSVSLIGNTTITAAVADATGLRVQKQRIQSLGSLSTLAPDLANGNIFEFTLSANTTINAPTNFQPGYYTFIVHNSTFSITTWNAAFKWPGATQPQSTTSGTDIWSFVSNGSAMMGTFVPGLG